MRTQKTTRQGCEAGGRGADKDCRVGVRVGTRTTCSKDHSAPWRPPCNNTVTDLYHSWPYWQFIIISRLHTFALAKLPCTVTWWPNRLTQQGYLTRVHLPSCPALWRDGPTGWLSRATLHACTCQVALHCDMMGRHADFAGPPYTRALAKLPCTATWRADTLTLQGHFIWTQNST